MRKLKLTYTVQIVDEESGETLLDNSVEHRANSAAALHHSIKSLAGVISLGAGVTSWAPEIADKAKETNQAAK
jgi:hypothetical protein